jgi:hypothetical protein
MYFRMLLSGLTGIILIEIYAAVMQREFQNTSNRVGKGFAILGIYLFVVAYCTPASLLASRLNKVANCIGTDGMLNSTTWLYGAEVLPIALRSKIMGLAAASHFIVNVAGKDTHFPLSCSYIDANGVSLSQSPKQAQVHLPTYTRTTTTCLSRVHFFS